MFDLKDYLAALRLSVDEQLLQYLGGFSPDRRIARAMVHSVMAGGKRLRPILCISAAETVGFGRQNVLPIACALEFVHTYSLIHDDLPAMDDDDRRRGKPTCHVAFDEATAILAGDALLTLAFEIMANAGGRCPADRRGRWLQAIAEVASAAGFNGMIEGQMQDMAFEGTSISQRALENLHRLKTGRIIEAAVRAGARIAGASATQLQALTTYAHNIGLAFQVADDILNITGDPEKLGKATGTDQSRGKNTYPALLGLDAAGQLAASLVNDALNAIESFDKRADSLRAIARYVIARNR